MDIADKKIAVVGVSADANKYGHRIFRDLLAAGYDVTGVNPGGGTVAGKTLYRALDELPDKPDLVVTVVPPPVTEKIVDECLRQGIKAIWMQPGSDSEQAVQRAEEAGMEVIHNSCIMVRNDIW